MKGKVINYNHLRGFGFIQSEDKLNRFFHISNVKTGEKPPIGALVKFVPETGPKGPIAINIRVLQAGAPKNIYFGEIKIPVNKIKGFEIRSVDIPTPEQNASVGFFSKLAAIFSSSKKKETEKVEMLFVSTVDQDFHFEKGKVNFDIFDKFEKLQKIINPIKTKEA